MSKVAAMRNTCGSCRIKRNKCRKCRSCGSVCDNPNYEEVGFLIDNVETFIVDLCEQEMKFSKSFYLPGSGGYDPDRCKNDTKKLLAYLRTLRRVWKALVDGGDESCLCDSNYRLLKEKVLKLIGVCKEGVSCQKVTKLDNDWLLNNPGMTTFERWERALYKVKPKIKINIEEVDREVLQIAYKVIAVECKNPAVAISVLEKNLVKNR